MRMKVINYGICLILAVTTLTVGACAGTKPSPQAQADAAFQDVRSTVEEVVADPRRAAEVAELLGEMERVFTDGAALIEERRTAFRELSSNYDTPQADLETALEQLRVAMRHNYSRYSEIRTRLSATLTDEEWDALQKVRSKALDKALAAARS